MPTELDNMALSSLTLSADTHRLYQMRYVDLPQSYYVSYSLGIEQRGVLRKCDARAHRPGSIRWKSPRSSRIFCLRFDKVTWCLVSGVYGNRLVLSLRTSDKEHSAGEVMRRLVERHRRRRRTSHQSRRIYPPGERTPTEIERHRTTLKRRLLRALGIRTSRGQRLVPVRDEMTKPQ